MTVHHYVSGEITLRKNHTILDSCLPRTSIAIQQKLHEEKK